MLIATVSPRSTISSPTQRPLPSRPFHRQIQRPTRRLKRSIPVVAVVFFGRCTTHRSFPENSSSFFLFLSATPQSLSSYTLLHRCSIPRIFLVFVLTQYTHYYHATLILFHTSRQLRSLFLVSSPRASTSLPCRRQESEKFSMTPFPILCPTSILKDWHWDSQPRSVLVRTSPQQQSSSALSVPPPRSRGFARNLAHSQPRSLPLSLDWHSN